MKIEDIIRSNKLKFEQEPSDQIWSKIEAKLKKDNKTPFWSNTNIIRIAAGIVVCISLGIGIGKVLYDKKEFKAEISNHSPALVSFSNEINRKQLFLEKLIDSNPALEKEFTNELKSLQDDFKTLENQLKINPNHDQLLDAMIQNLKWQIDVLNQQTDIAKKVNQNSIM